jgi:hypothetical protein
MQQDGSSTTRVPRQRHDSEHLWLALEAGTDVAGPYHSSSSKSCSTWTRAVVLTGKRRIFAGGMLVEAATQRRKGGGTIGRWSGKLDDCGGRVYQHKEG